MIQLRRRSRPDLAGAAAFDPCLTAWSYWVFRGKVGEHCYH